MEITYKDSCMKSKNVLWRKSSRTDILDSITTETLLKINVMKFIDEGILMKEGKQSKSERK